MNIKSTKSNSNWKVMYDFYCPLTNEMEGTERWAHPTYLMVFSIIVLAGQPKSVEPIFEYLRVI